MGLGDFKYSERDGGWCWANERVSASGSSSSFCRLDSAAVFKRVALTGLLGLGESFSVANYGLSRNGDRVWKALTAGENDLGIKWSASAAFSQIDTN